MRGYVEGVWERWSIPTDSEEANKCYDIVAMRFKDHFSEYADRYSQYRPTYPDGLFDWLATLTTRHDRAWDCGTGNGQAAVALARHFAEVIATDPSEKQIAQGEAHPRVKYRVARAEESGVESQSVDLAVVAQALHWFDLTKFYGEVRRVVRPAGVLAVWCYDLAMVTPEIDVVIYRLYHDIVAAYWFPERRLVEERYASIPFPFAELKPPAFAMQADWNFDRLIGYLGTWWAVEQYRKKTGNDPVGALLPDLRAGWGDAATRRISWPLCVRAGVV